MDNVLKNILILGTAVFIVVCAFAYTQLQNNQVKIAEAERAVLNLGKDDAVRAFESNERYLLAAAYGWGLRDIPGFDLDLYSDCLASEIGLRIFWDYTDVYRGPAAGNRFRALTTMPKSTETYAGSFNKTMLEQLRSTSETACRIPITS